MTIHREANSSASFFRFFLFSWLFAVSCCFLFFLLFLSFFESLTDAFVVVIFFLAAAAAVVVVEGRRLTTTSGMTSLRFFGRLAAVLLPGVVIKRVVVIRFSKTRGEAGVRCVSLMSDGAYPPVASIVSAGHARVFFLCPTLQSYVQHCGRRRPGDPLPTIVPPAQGLITLYSRPSKHTHTHTHLSVPFRS